MNQKEFFDALKDTQGERHIVVEETKVPSAPFQVVCRTLRGSDPAGIALALAKKRLRARKLKRKFERWVRLFQKGATPRTCRPREQLARSVTFQRTVSDRYCGEPDFDNQCVIEGSVCNDQVHLLISKGQDNWPRLDEDDVLALIAYLKRALEEVRRRKQIALERRETL